MGAYVGQLAKKNGNTFGSIALKTSSPGLELNDLGLQGRTGYSAISTLIGRQSFTAGKRLSSWSAYAYQNDAFNYGGRAIFHGYAASGNATYDRPRLVTLARLSRDLGPGATALDLKLDVLARAPSAVATAVAVDRAGTRRVAAQRVTLG